MTRPEDDVTIHSPVPDCNLADQIAERYRDEGESDEGAISAEYAVATVAAVAFASLLIAVVSSPEIREALLQIIRGALNLG